MSVCSLFPYFTKKLTQIFVLIFNIREFTIQNFKNFLFTGILCILRSNVRLCFSQSFAVLEDYFLAFLLFILIFIFFIFLF